MSDTSHLRSALIMGASVVALASMAAPALAQPVAAPAAPAGAADQGGANDVTVVAEKRVSTVQKVPVAVTAFSAKQRNIEGITTIQDITDYTPGLTYSSQLDRTQMRGLGRLTNELGADSAVAIYNDDFYSTSTFNVGLDDLFVDRVEIERGPQGTLYGRNAIGGLINTISKRPTDDFSGEVRANIGNFDKVNVEGTVSGPIAPNLDFRLSGLFNNQSQGYFKNVAGGPTEGGVVHDFYVNATLEWKPTDKDDIWVAGSIQGFDTDRGGPGSLLGTPTLGQFDTALVSSVTDPVAFNPNFGYSTVAANAPGCVVTGGSGNANCFSTGLGAPGTPNSQPAGTALTPIPGSVVGAAGTGNPALGNIRDFAHSIPTTIGLHNTFAVNFHYTHHFDDFDVKYVGGYSQYNYQLDTSTFFEDNSAVTNYQIPVNPATLCGIQSSSAPYGPFVGNFVGCGPLTVDPSTDFRYIEHNRWYSHEITFSSTTKGPVQWIAGAFYYDQHYYDPQSIIDPGQPQYATPISSGFGPSAPNPSRTAVYSAYHGETKSAAVYGQVDWKITDTLKITGGLRYTSDDKSIIEDHRVILFGDFPAFAAAGVTAETFGSKLPAIDVTAGGLPTGNYPGVTCAIHFLPNGDAERCLHGTSSAVTGTARLEWTPSSEMLGYISYNRGYKALGFTEGSISPFPEAKPELVDDYEIGWKQSIGQVFQYNVDAFYYNYQNDQIPIGVQTNTGIVTQFFNIPKAESEGVEFQAYWEPIPRLVLNLTYSYNKTAVDSRCTLVAGVPTGTCLVDAADSAAVAPGAQPVGPLVAGARVQNVSGQELPQAPANKVAFNVNYTWQFDPGDFTVSGSYVWKDKSYASVFDRTFYSAPQWDEVDLRAVWSGDHDKYEIVGYVKNVFNTLGYDSAGAPIVTIVPAAIDTAFDLTPPRTYGVELHYKW